MWRILPLGDGRAIVAAKTANGILFVRLDAGGRLDPSFGIDGVSPKVGLDAQDVALACDGRIIVSGRLLQPYPTPQRFAAAILTPKGAFS